MPALGDQFRAARESRGLSLSDVAEHLRIRSVYLAAIEDEDWNAIGAAVYIRGFLRTYARFLGLEPEAAVAAYRSTLPESVRASEDDGSSREPRRETVSEGASEKVPGRTSQFVVWGLALVAAAMVGFVVYNEVAMRSRSPGPDAVAVATASPSPSQPGTPSPLPSPVPVAETLQLRLDAPSWLSVTVDGNASIVGTFPAGTARTFHGKNATIRVGNAGAVEVLVDGKSLGKLGGSGDVVERTFAL